MNNYYLSDTHPVTLGMADADKPKQRSFTGIANSGKPFDYYGTRAIVELSSVVLSDKVPALLLHDRDKRVGFGALAVQNNELVINGTLLTNDEAVRLAQDADDGFPLQLSAHLSTSDYTDLKENETAVVNGQTYYYPLRILKNCTVPEVSFTPTGVDRETVAMILSQTHNQKENAMANPNDPKDTHADELHKTISQLQAELETLKNENAELKKQAKKANVEAKLSQAGFTKDDKGDYVGISGATVEMLLSLDDDKVGAVINDFKPKNTQSLDFLLSEQHGTDAGQSANPAPTNPLVANAKARK